MFEPANLGTKGQHATPGPPESLIIYSSGQIILTGLAKDEDLEFNSEFPTIFIYTGRFIMFSMITNIYNKKTKGPTLMELFTATGKLKKFFFLTIRDVQCMYHG